MTQSPPFADDRTALRRTLRKFDYDLLRAYSKRHGYTGRLPKKDKLVDELLDAHEWPTLVCELTHITTRSVVDPNSDVWASSVVVQTGYDVLGPLGVLRSRASRTAAYHLVGLLQEGSKTDLLEQVAKQCCAGHEDEATSMRYIKTLPGRIARLCYLQLTLLGTNDDIARAANQAVRDLERPLTVPSTWFREQWVEDWKFGSCPAPPCEWGFPRIGDATKAEEDLLEACMDEHATRALGVLLLQRGGKALEAATARFATDDPLVAATELVLMQGPGKVLDTFFSERDLWELLTEWDLAVPPLLDLTRQELLDVLLGQIGLHYVPAAKGLHKLQRDLVHRGPSLDDDPLALLLHFEHAYEELLCAFVALASDLEDDNGDMNVIATLRRERPSDLAKEWQAIVPERGLSSLSFGSKVSAMHTTLTMLGVDTDSRPWMGRPSPELLAGASVQAVVQTRNALAHGRDGSSPEQVRKVIVNALSAMIGDDHSVSTCPVPYRVRVLEETVDVFGWRRMTLETELGERIKADSTVSERPKKSAFLFGRSNPAVVEPTLIW